MPNEIQKTSNQSHKDEHFDTRIGYFLTERENLFEVETWNLWKTIKSDWKMS